MVTTALPGWATAWERAESALARLDERLKGHPAREGWLARTVAVDASASAALEAAWVESERIALWESDAAEAPADSALRLGYGIVRAWRAAARAEAGEVLTADGILELHGRLIGADSLPLVGVDGVDKILAWLETLEELERTPALPAAGLALAAWHRLAPLRHGEATGRLLTAVYLWRRGKTQGPFTPIARGFREGLADYRPFDPPERWLPLFLSAVARGATQGVKDLAALTLARQRLMERCESHRRNSRLAQVVTLLIDRPVVSSGDVAQVVGMTRRGAMMLLEGLAGAGVIEEVSGRERFRLYRAMR
ncbi:DUF1612 domain-containing protein [Azospirillum sp.]|uniref:DUF1612 domain-containing protein n=1 Tax=Azospirillum sp. TaxID=34012 RepID=UPI002D4E6ABD|nr:DUF1612 domain-containing protein [Azospirillum sp.]HYD64556.1 DUF1612 domain-containing protein [Azospirillum sp.]